MPLEISRLWAKGAVIPRNGQGEALKINGYYMMFLSEGCGGHQYIGYSRNMLEWEFRQETYLQLPAEMGDHIFEVACAIAGHNNRDMVLDFFFRNNDGEFEAGQALYDLANPLIQLDIHTGGTLAWGGISQYHGQWIYPQGWESPLFIEEMYFYTAGIKANGLPGC